MSPPYPPSKPVHLDLSFPDEFSFTLIEQAGMSQRSTEGSQVKSKNAKLKLIKTTTTNSDQPAYGNVPEKTNEERRISPITKTFSRDRYNSASSPPSIHSYQSGWSLQEPPVEDEQEG